MNYNLILSTALIIVSIASFGSSNKCKSDQIEYLKEDGTSFCYDCIESHCGIGYQLSPSCGSVVQNTEENQPDCIPCVDGETYSDTYSIEKCKPCRNCGKENRDVLEDCTRKSNTKCGNCSSGFYEENGECYCCSYCCGDANDKIIPECTVMPKNRQCHVHNQDGKCSKDKKMKNGCPANKRDSKVNDGGNVSKDSGDSSVVVIVLIILVVAAISLGTVIFWWKKRKERIQRPGPEQTEIPDNNNIQMSNGIQPQVQVPPPGRSDNDSLTLTHGSQLEVELPASGGSDDDSLTSTHDDPLRVQVSASGGSDNDSLTSMGEKRKRSISFTLGEKIRRPSLQRSYSSKSNDPEELKGLLTLHEHHDSDGEDNHSQHLHERELQEKVNAYIKNNTVQTLFSSFTLKEEVGCLLEDMTSGIKNWKHFADNIALSPDTKEELQNECSKGGKVGELVITHLIHQFPDKTIEEIIKIFHEMKRNDIIVRIKDKIENDF